MSPARPVSRAPEPPARAGERCSKRAGRATCGRSPSCRWPTTSRPRPSPTAPGTEPAARDRGAAAPGGRGPQEAGRRGGSPRASGGGKLRFLRAVRVRDPGRAAHRYSRDQVLPALRRAVPCRRAGGGQVAGGTCHPMTAVPVWAWAATLAVLAVLIVVDLALTRGPENGLRAAAVESALWVAAALAFGAVLWLWRGPAIGSQYLAGYLLERALSVDNVFVFVLLFAPCGCRPNCSGGSCSSAWSARSCSAASSSRPAARSSRASAGSSTCSARWCCWPGRACSGPARADRGTTWPCAACAGCCRSPSSTTAAASSPGRAAGPWPRPCSWRWWPSR